MNSRLSSMTTPAFLMVGSMFVAVFAGCGGSSSPSSTTAVNNTAAVTVDFGPNGQSNGIVNGLFTTISVCQHGSSTCVSIPNVEVDTGSVGLRLVPSALGSLTLTPININGAPLEECIQYGDTSYSWGPMEFADVLIAGERAIDVPVQVLGATTAPAPPNCLTTPVSSSVPNGGNEDTVATLGSNGILGIGSFVFDCGSACTTVSFTSGYPYYICPSGNCQAVGVPTPDQAENPVAAFATADNNGVMITLPSVPSTGAVTVSGTMNFGIGTRSDNVLGTANLYALDPCGSFPTVTFNGVSYTDSSCNQGGSGLGGFVDTGSNALFVSDASTLSSFGISDCPSTSMGSGFYCVSGGTVTLSNIDLLGYLNVGSANISLNISNATTLFNSNNAVFKDLGGDSPGGSSPSTDSFDLGMPFFLGRTVFIGIAGQAVPTGASAPNGFVAF